MKCDTEVCYIRGAGKRRLRGREERNGEAERVPVFWVSEQPPVFCVWGELCRLCCVCLTQCQGCVCSLVLCEGRSCGNYGSPALWPCMEFRLMVEASIEKCQLNLALDVLIRAHRAAQFFSRWACQTLERHRLSVKSCEVLESPHPHHLLGRNNH